MTAHATALTQPIAAGELYLEIEGIPYAFGTHLRGSSWFDVSGQAFEGIKPALRIIDSGDLPTISAQRVDFIESRVSIGSLRVGIVDTGDTLDDNSSTLAGYVAPWRSDDLVRLDKGTTSAVNGGTATTTVIPVADGGLFPLGGTVEISDQRRKVVARTASSITLSSALSGAPADATAITVYDLAASSSATTATLKNDARDGGNYADWPSDGVCWFGSEACTFTRSGADLTLARGKYRSMPLTHGGTWATPTLGRAGNEARATLYPDGLVGRRCWLRWGLDAASDADAVDLFVGSIANAQWDTGGRLLVLELEDAQSWLRKPLFSDLPERLPAGLAVRQDLIGASLSLSRGEVNDLLPVGSYVVAARGGEVIAFGRDASVGGGTNPFILARELFGSVPVDDRDMLATVPAIVTGRVGASTLGRSLAVSDGAISFSHPLQVMLALLTSTGTGSNGAYDTLPAEWGLGVPADEIDLAAIEDLVSETFDLNKCRFVVLEPIDDFREWAIATLLKPFGFYLRTTFSKAISVGRIRALSPDAIAGAVSLSLSDVATKSDGGFAVLEGPTQENAAVVGSVVVRSSPYIEDGKIEWGDEQTIGLVSSDVRRGYQSAQRVELESWLNPDARPGAAQDTFFGAFYFDLLSNLWARFEVPPSILRIAVQPDPFARLNAGDLVSVTLPDLPNATSGERGYGAEIFEVWGKSIDLPSNHVVLELAQTSLNNTRARYLAPGCVAPSSGTVWNDGTKTLTVEQNAFTEAGGDYDDTDAFEAGQAVRLVSEAMDSTAAATIASVTATTIVLTQDAAALGVTPGVGWHVVPANYDTATAATRARYAYRADSGARLGSANDAPHQHA